MSLGAIRAGRGEVELGLNQTMLELGLASARNKLQSFASRVTAFGSFLAGGGIAAALTSIPIGMIFATYDQELANLRAATNPTVEQFDIMRASIEKIARMAGESPAEVARAFTELAKAGVSVNTILNGAGEAAIMFGRVSGMAIGETAIVLADAMSVFRRDGLSAFQVATILNRAADSSSVSLRDVADAIGASGSTLAMWNQSLSTTATLVGILGNYGIKGAEAGTALKTFFLRLTSGTDGAADAMRQMGLVVRDNTGEMLPAVEIVRRLAEATRGMGLEQRDQIFAQLAGARGIRALSVLVQEGTAGFEAFQLRMGQSLNIQQRFAIMTDTLSGSFRKMWVAIQLAAIKIGDILLPAIRGVMAGVQGLFGTLEIVATDNPEIIRGFFLAALGLTAWGIALVAVGKALEIVSFLMSPFLAMLRLAQTLLFSATSSMVAFAASVYFRGVFALNAIINPIKFAVISLGVFGYSIIKAGMLAAWFAANSLAYMVAGLWSLVPSMSAAQRFVNGLVFAFDILIESVVNSAIGITRLLFGVNSVGAAFGSAAMTMLSVAGTAFSGLTYILQASFVSAIGIASKISVVFDFLIDAARVWFSFYAAIWQLAASAVSISVSTMIAFFRALNFASAIVLVKNIATAVAMGVVSAATAIASLSLSALSGAYVVAAAVGNFFVFTLGLYKVALIAVTIAQAIATSGLSLLLGVMVTLASATLTVAGVFLAVTGAAALFIGLGGSFAAIADWLEVIDDIVEFLVDGFYAFIDAVMDSPIGSAISWINEVVLELWNSFGLLYDGIVEFLVVSGMMEIAENVMYAIVGAVAVLATLIGVAAYGWYLLLQQFSIRDVFSYINRGIMEFSNVLRSIAETIRPTITAIGEFFAGMFSYLINIGRSTIGSFTSLFVDAARDIARQMTTWFNFVFASISTSVATIRDRFMEMFARVAADVVVIWEALQNAFSAGNWRLLWDIAVITFRIAWHEISAFAIDVFYAMQDALVDVFSSTSLLIQNVFTRLWGNVKAGFLTMMADVLGGLGVGGMADFFAAIGVNIGPIAQAAANLRGQALGARIGAGNEIRDRNQGQEDNANVNEMVRWFRDQARAVENEIEGNALRNELDQLAIQAWFEAQAAQVNQEIAGDANRRNFGEGNEVARMNASSIGTFSSDVAKGFLGAGPESPFERANRELAEANRLALRQIEALNAILRQAGFPMFQL